jgi:hypothetical protein
MHLVAIDPRVQRGHRGLVIVDVSPIACATLFVLAATAAACGEGRLASEGRAGTVITSDPTAPASSDDDAHEPGPEEGDAAGNAMPPGERPAVSSSSGGNAPDKRSTSTEAGAGSFDAATGPIDAGDDGAICNSVWLSDWQENGPVQLNTCKVVPPNNSGLKPPGSACQSSFDCAQECCDCMPGHGQYIALCQCGTCASKLCGRSFNDPANGTLTTCGP